MLMAGNGKLASGGSRGSNTMLILLGVIVVYQLAYHVVMDSSVRQREADEDAQCDSGSFSQVCVEAQVFRTWQAAARPEGELHDIFSASEAELLQTVVKAETIPAAGRADLAAGPGDGGAALTAAPETVESSPTVDDNEYRRRSIAAEIKSSEFQEKVTKEAKANVEVIMRQQLARSRKAVERANSLPLAKVANAGGGALLDRVMEAGREMCMAPHRRDFPACKQFQVHPDAPAERIPKKAAKKPTIVSSHKWESEIVDIVDSLGRELCSDPERSQRSSCRQFHQDHHSAPAVSVADAVQPEKAWSNMTDWAKDLMAKQAELEHRKEVLHNHHAHPSAHPSSSLEVPEAWSNLTTWAKQLESRQRELEHLRQELQSRHNHSHSHSHSHSHATHLRPKEAHAEHLEERLHELADVRHVWETVVIDHVSLFHQELCKDPRRADYFACAQLHGAVKAQPKPEEIVDDGTPRRLDWPAVAAWKTPSSLRGRRARTSDATIIIDKVRLEGERWSGKIPKVACVTLIPFTDDESVRAWLRNFVGQFHQQEYEGKTELVLVYHALDVETARLVNTFTKGTNVRGAAARNIDFPSSASFRYGAWLSDADVIARWDFDAYHDKRRLAMQVRALGLSARPASMLTSVTSFAVNGSSSVSTDTHKISSSIVGEGKWMRDNWFPLVGATKELGSIIASEALGHIARVAMPELVIHQDALDLDLEQSAAESKNHRVKIAVDKPEVHPVVK